MLRSRRQTKTCDMEQSVTLAALARRVRQYIEGLVAPQPHPDQLGSALPPEWFACQLDEMRAALVDPYIVEVDGDGRFAQSAPRRVAIVAEDKDVLLAFDPDPEGDFALIFRSAAGFGLSNIRGGAVDCFMSR